MSRETVVIYEDDEATARLTVVRANFGQELDRSDFIMQAEAVEDANTVRRYARRLLLPALLAATTQAQIRLAGDEHDLAWPIGFGDLLSLPAALIDRWTDAVFSLNPSWNPQAPTAPDGDAAAQAVEKKAPASTAG